MCTSARLPGVKSERGSVLDGCDRQLLDRNLLLCRTLPTTRWPERGRRSRGPEAEVCSQPIPHQVQFDYLDYLPIVRSCYCAVRCWRRLTSHLRGLADAEQG